MSPIRTAAVLAAALLVSACLPVTTKTPAGSTAGFKADPALYGVWKGHGSDSDESGYISFLKNDDGSMTAVLISPPSASSGGDWDVYRLDVAALGNRHFMTARELFNDGKPAGDDDNKTGGILLSYRIEGNTLTLYVADEDKAAAAVKAGALHGTISGDEKSPDVALTSAGPELDKYLSSPAGAALFTKPLLVMKREP